MTFQKRSEICLKKKTMSSRCKVQQELTTIRGLVIPVDWDENGIVTAIAISTYDEEQYLIDKDEKGEELLSLLRQEVQISGTVRREDDNKRIKVKKYYATC